jgi:hypothetical protein
MFFNRFDKTEYCVAPSSVALLCSEGKPKATVSLYHLRECSWKDHLVSELPVEDKSFYTSDDNAIIFDCESYKGVSYNVIVFPFIFWDPNLGDLYEPICFVMNAPRGVTYDISKCRFKRYVSGPEYEQMVKEYKPYG